MKTMVELVAELRALATPELVARYESVYGKPPRSRSLSHKVRSHTSRHQPARPRDECQVNVADYASVRCH